jgi:general secretion pathway protein N
MIATLKRFPVISALAAVAVVLLAIVLLEIASGSVAQRQLANAPVQRTAAVEAKLLPAIIAVSAEEAYPESGARPLFTPTRRPAPPGAVAATSSMPKGLFVLSGVTIAGPLRIALLREKSTGRVVRAEKGKEVNGMTVLEIEPDSVTLAMSGDQEVIPLRVQKGPGAPPAAPTGPFAGPAAPAAPPAPAPAPSVEPPIVAGQNPAARPPSPPSAFGPAPAMPPAPPAGAQPNQSIPMTPEELLAARRARRSQQTQ